MRGEIVRAEIRLGLDDFSDVFRAAGNVDQKFSQQFARDPFGVAVVKCARQFLHAHNLAIGGKKKNPAD